MAEFTVGLHTYKAAPLSALAQFHLARKLSPVIAPFLETALPVLNKAADGLSTRDLPALLKDVSPFLKVLAELPEAEVNYVIETCLATVTRKEPKGGGWSPVWSKAGGAMMFDDIKMPDMLVIAAHVIQDNLADFMPAPRSISTAAA
jgi:hypothetical protein